MTTIKKCDCKHEFQDKEYGKNNRVHNSTENTNLKKRWRCTVCGKEH